MFNISRTIVRGVTTSAVRRNKPDHQTVTEGLQKIKKLQTHFQKADGKPVHLKGGWFDQVLYRTTVGLCILALFEIGRATYDMGGFGKKDEE